MRSDDGRGAIGEGRGAIGDWRLATGDQMAALYRVRDEIASVAAVPRRPVYDLSVQPRIDIGVMGAFLGAVLWLSSCSIDPPADAGVADAGDADPSSGPFQHHCDGLPEGAACTPRECAFGLECAAADGTIPEGLCVPPTGGPSCTAEASCPTGFDCVIIARNASRCAPHGAAVCTSESDCGSGLICDFSMVAQAGVCVVPGDVGATCNLQFGVDQDGCRAGLLCGGDSTCVDPCGGCPAGQACTDDARNGVSGCDSPGEPNTPCCDDSECRGGARCIDERCSVDPCGMDTACPAGERCGAEQLDCERGVTTCVAPAEAGEVCLDYGDDPQGCSFVGTPCADELRCTVPCGTESPQSFCCG